MESMDVAGGFGCKEIYVIGSEKTTLMAQNLKMFIFT